MRYFLLSLLLASLISVGVYLFQFQSLGFGSFDAVKLDGTANSESQTGIDLLQDVIKSGELPAGYGQPVELPEGFKDL